MTVANLSNIGNLRAATTGNLPGQCVYIEGYRAANDGGGGMYVIGAAGTDNGGTRIIDASGRTWHLETHGAPLSALQFGAVGDDATDNTAALQLWLDAGTDLYLPAGRYRSRALSLSGVNGLNLVGGGVGVGTAAGSTGSYLILSAADSTLLTLSGCNGTVRDISFQPTGALQSLSGAVGLDIASSDNLILERCNVMGFSAGGIDVTGSSSGLRVFNCLIIYNGNVQLALNNANDFMIVNCQVGSASVPSPVYGLQLTSSSNGAVINVYFWGNGIALYSTSSDYLRIIGNRFELSNQQGVLLNTCTGLAFVGNWLNANSQSNKGYYDNAYFENCANATIGGNISYDWSGGSTSHRFGLALDPNCSECTMSANQCSGWTLGPTYVSNLVQGLNYEFLSVGITENDAVPLNSNVFETIMSLNLSTGVWEVSGTIAFQPNASSLSQIAGEISTSRGIGGTAATGSYSQLYAAFEPLLNYDPALSVGPAVFNIGTSDTLNLIAIAAFSGACSAYGYLQAKRLS